MNVSVIIPFRNRNEILIKCINSVKNQNYKDVEIITASDTTVLKERGVKSVRDSRCKGPGFKRNLGASVAKGDILFFLDSDCILKKNTIENLLKVFNETGADAVSGKPLKPHKGNFLGYIVGLMYEDAFDRMGESYVNAAATTCFAVKKDVFKAIKGFNEYSEGEAIGEDWDFSVRLTGAGFKIFHTNKVEVFHEHGSDTLKKYLKRQYEHARYRVSHYRKFNKTTDSYSTPGFFVTSMILLNMPATIRVYERTKDKKVFIGLPLITFLRTIAWLYGMVLGVIKD